MRADGKRIRNESPMYTVVAHIMSKRVDSMNMITIDVPVAPMQAYIREHKADEHPITHMGLIVAAYLRTVAEFPSLNRFIVNKNLYARNEFCVGLVVLKEGKDADGTMSKIYFDMTDDIFTVQRKIDEYISENRVAYESNGTEKMIRFLLSIPGLCRFGVNLFKWADKHGFLPKKVIAMSPFHASLLLSNLASIRTNHIYHHVYEFGTTSIAVTMGNLREVPRRKADGIEFERCLPLGIVMDERIASGSYFALAFRQFIKYIKNPQLLEGEPKVYNKDACFK